MEPVKVVIFGAAGKVGQVLTASLPREPGIQLVGAVDALANQEQLSLPDGSTVPFSSDLTKILTACRPDVMVDFTIAKATMPAVRLAAQHKVNLVIGTTGLTADNLAEIERLAKSNDTGVVVASNFAIGAILMMHFAKIASKFMDNAEIIELHHHLKADAPSGTSLSTAKGMLAAREKPFNHPPEPEKTPDSRGLNVDGVNIHSVRLPGLMAHQEVIFGGLGQTLSIRHDTIGRECYVPGVALAIKKVAGQKGLTIGLDTLLGL